MPKGFTLVAVLPNYGLSNELCALVTAALHMTCSLHRQRQQPRYQYICAEDDHDIARNHAF